MNEPPNPKRRDQTHDIIIIGAGTSGCVLANRLSTDPTLSILLLEAGRNHNSDPQIYTPGLSQTLLDNEIYDWRFNTEAEPGLDGRTIKHPRGKVVGGSSAINSFALIYPNRAGIDVWETMGSKGWNWQGLEPFFRRFQNVSEPVAEVREGLNLAHGVGTVQDTKGPLKASFPPRVQWLQKAWVETWKNVGLGCESDAFGGRAMGGHTSTCHISADRKERSHAGVAFLEPLQDRENLTIITEAMVEKIVFSDEDGKVTAMGVQYTKDNTTHVALANKEIILAAGAFGSPALLELSGIGDRNRLSDLGIPIVHHNPAVGENLQDHIRGGVSFEAAEGVPPRFSMPEEEARRLYERDRSGPWGESVCWAFAYMPLLPFLSDPEKTEFLKLLHDGLLETPAGSKFEGQRDEFIRGILSSPDEAAATVYLARKPAILPQPTTPEAGAEASEPTNWISLFAMLAHPFSSGNTHITSSSAADKPSIRANYYTHPLDIEVHARIMNALETLATTPPLCDYIKPSGKRSLREGASMDEVKAYLRKEAGTNYHPVGTCAMLPEGDGGVVDAELRVYGVKGLRVVDASVFPVVTRGNVIATVYAVAEKAADMVAEGLEL